MKAVGHQMSTIAIFRAHRPYLNQQNLKPTKLHLQSTTSNETILHRPPAVSESILIQQVDASQDTSGRHKLKVHHSVSTFLPNSTDVPSLCHRLLNLRDSGVKECLTCLQCSIVLKSRHER